jgi:hypothetical protein
MSQTDVGIVVEQNAGPTLLNNVVANLFRGVQVDTSSRASTIVGTTLYHNNIGNAQGIGGTNPLGDFPLTPPAAQQIFENPAAGNFYPAALSPLIDSSLSSLNDRTAFVSVKSPLGLPPSPILSPLVDLFGQLRVDDRDVDTPSGQGENVSVDRGAVDRADFVRPWAELLNPLDNDAARVDQDLNATVVWLLDAELPNFSLLLLDGSGTGIDTTTVTPGAVTMTQNGRQLQEGIDFWLGYNAGNNRLLLTPLSELWEPDSVYQIRFTNSGTSAIRDRAGNLLRANQPNGQTLFTIITGDLDIDFGDAPNSYGTLLASDGARHVQIPRQTLWLGASTDGDPDGRPTPDASGDDVDAYALPGTSRLQLVSPSSHSIRTPAAGGPGGVTARLPAWIEVEDLSGATVRLHLRTVPLGGTDEIVYGATDSSRVMSARIAEAIGNAAGLTGVTAVPSNGGIVQIDGARNVTLSGGNLWPLERMPAALRLPANYAASGIDGLTFTISDGVRAPVTFEFDNNSTALSGTTVIAFTAGEPNQPLAARMADAISAALPGLTAAVSEPSPGTYQIELALASPPAGTFRNDDDGVVISGAFHIGVNNLTPITVTASGPGFLDAWVDFNGNGVFGLSEKVINSQPVVAGVNIFQVTTPTNAVLGSTFARFRLSSQGGVDPTGLAIGGEVEDYLVEIVSASPPLRFRRLTSSMKTPFWNRGIPRPAACLDNDLDFGIAPAGRGGVGDARP